MVGDLGGSKVSFGDDKDVFELIVVMFAKFCEYTKSHRIVHFKWVNFMICELDLNKPIMKKKGKKKDKERVQRY